MYHIILLSDDLVVPSHVTFPVHDTFINNNFFGEIISLSMLVKLGFIIALMPGGHREMCYDGNRHRAFWCRLSRISHRGARWSWAPPPISWSIPGLLARMDVSTVLIHSSFWGVVWYDFRFWQVSWKRNLSESKTLSAWEYICVMIQSTYLLSASICLSSVTP